MRTKGVFFCLMSFFLVLFLAGCKTGTSPVQVRTYTVEEPRVDQNLAEGNRGYLMGCPQDTEKDKNRKLTRTKYVAEFEFVSKAKDGSKEDVIEEDVDLEIAQEPEDEYLIEEIAVEEKPVAVKETKTVKYTVGKNDTLQKISMKFYGTTKKWKKIYDANSDKMKSPDRIYKGQVLNIPQD
ncbi:MAG: LysM peptidoglycan-binding domain-containing protein [Candidatus Omnitrophota bacterium]